MRILIAPDSFKGTLTAAEAAEAIARGVGEARPDAELDCCPMADGGEGTVEALVHASGGAFEQADVCGPIGGTVTARWGLLGGPGDANLASPAVSGGRAAVIEMAQAAGLMLVPDARRDPTRATTYGVGQLIAAALDAGCSRIILGLGGSATCDGGLGALQALGARFLRSDGRPVAQPATASDLAAVADVDARGIEPRLAAVDLRIACDVTNPLVGPDGAAVVYGPQKGATEAQVRRLDADLAHFASVVGGNPEAPGAGAAGGLGFGLVALAGARLERGVALIMDAVGFDHRLRQADLLVTGEGQLDAQSLSGKTCMGLAERAARLGVPSIALVGRKGDGADASIGWGLGACRAIVGEVATVAEAMREPAIYLHRLARLALRDPLPGTTEVDQSPWGTP